MTPGLGIVLSGGGALGAYEAGVLDYVFGRLARELRIPAVAAIAGTSSGAFNGAFLASVLEAPAQANRLVKLWSELELHDVLRFDRHVRNLAGVLVGGPGPRALFDGRQMRSVIDRAIDWPSVGRAIDRGALGALAVSATRISTGQAVVFVQRAKHTPLRGELGANVTVRDVSIRTEHVAASSAIPLVFPPVEVEGELYFDGGLCLNTPIAPALHLGADRLLVVSISSADHQGETQVVRDRTPGLVFLAGKAINAVMLDRVSQDLEHLEQINRILAAGARACGPTFFDQLDHSLEESGQHPLRIIEHVVVRPREDVGAMAAAYLRDHRGKIDHTLGRALFKLLDTGVDRAADLAAYLLFDRGFTRMLSELGWRDAAEQTEHLAELFGRRELERRAM